MKVINDIVELGKAYIAYAKEANLPLYTFQTLRGMPIGSNIAIGDGNGITIYRNDTYISVSFSSNQDCFDSVIEYNSHDVLKLQSITTIDEGVLRNIHDDCREFLYELITKKDEKHSDS